MQALISATAPSARVARGTAPWRALLLIAAAGALAGCASAPTLKDPAAEAAIAFSSAAAARDAAVEALVAGRTADALGLYLEAVQIDPQDAESFYQIGVIQERMGDKARAARSYAKAVELAPEHAAALEALGFAYFDADEIELAEAMLKRAVAANVFRARAHDLLGIIADSREDYGAAAVHYTASLDAAPSAATFNNRGYSRYLSGDPAGAERDFLAALAIDSGYERAQRNLGLAYARQGMYEQALGALGKTASPHVAANDVGYIAMLRGDYAMAERLFAEALRLSPRFYPTAAENLEELRRRRGSSAAPLARAAGIGRD